MSPYNLPRSLVLIALLLQVTASYSKPESEVLLGFKASLANNGALLSWNSSTPPCSGDKENWVGVLCDNGNVWGLKLENMGLAGGIDVEAIKELPGLRTISLMNNNFDGSFPSLKQLGALKSVYLSNNKFSGEIESNAFDGMQSLKKIHLANNQFTGLIPLSLTILPKLIEVSLEENHFNGEIPDFKLGILKSINLSNNELEGQIPQSLSKMSADSFSGNGNLCGAPLVSCSSSAYKQLPVTMIAVVAVSLVAALAAILAVVIILCRHRHMPISLEALPTAGGHKKAASADLDRVEQGDDAERFDLGDLLKASAEVLGSGYFGSSYKAALMTGKMMVVKRFRHMNNVGREEFQEHMRRLGRLGHTNLLPLVAFYYRKEEKLLVSEYVNNVSLAVHLHGNRSRGQPSPDWPTRLKIIKGVAKGLQYLYNELPSLIIPHGHLKSSNVLLNESFEPLLTDYGLVPVVNQEHAQEVMVAYKSPEHKQNGRVTKKTDVWSLGILILETLTGKFPANYLQGKGSDTNLVAWVNSVVREESTGEVFDKDMGATKNCEGEMMKLLKIGMACAEADVEKRCDLKEAIEKIEEVKEKDNDEEFYSSYPSEGDVKSSTGLSDGFSYSLS
ncbi:leucine-rich repeat protein kinase family protein [Actinidia rufa]|uniref:Leucine-rich repeat protein kinase family protein n=1 Tax=Actinidia rufa TaxID=165716 RepID=A0A7J0GEF2_9ERIC|nr:leucine-rich repeat protein kinase family protein [Actinidia rufa]